MEGKAVCIKNSPKVLYCILDKCDLLKSMGEYDRWGEILKKFEENSKGQTGYYYVMSCVEMWMDYYKTTEQKDNVRALQIPNAVTTASQYLTVSQGYVLMQGVSSSESVYTVLKLADQALYSVKKNDKNGYCIYSNKQRL